MNELVTGTGPSLLRIAKFRHFEEATNLARRTALAATDTGPLAPRLHSFSSSADEAPGPSTFFSLNEFGPDASSFSRSVPATPLSSGGWSEKSFDAARGDSLQSGTATDLKNSVVESAARTSIRVVHHDSAPTFRPLEQWTGSVESVDREARTFVARVISSSQVRDEFADFTFDEVSDDDHELINEGSLFYWSVGYEIAASKQRSTVSTVRFRRVHVWKRPQIEKALIRAKSLTAWLLE